MKWGEREREVIAKKLQIQIVRLTRENDVIRNDAWQIRIADRQIFLFRFVAFSFHSIEPNQATQKSSHITESIVSLLCHFPYMLHTEPPSQSVHGKCNTNWAQTGEQISKQRLIPNIPFDYLLMCIYSFACHCIVDWLTEQPYLAPTQPCGFIQAHTIKLSMVFCVCSRFINSIHTRTHTFRFHQALAKSNRATAATAAAAI